MTKAIYTKFDPNLATQASSTKSSKENPVTKTIEEISYIGSTKDLWNELHNEINPLSCMLHIHPGNSQTIRFLGPFVRAQRFYHKFGLSNNITN